MARGADMLGGLLQEAGVKYVFGIPGGQVLSIIDFLRRTPSIRFVTVRHEGAAAVMADAVGRITGRPGVCLATTGPGATNLLTGIGGALKDSSPVVILVASNNQRDFGRDDAQDLDHIQVFAPLVKHARRVTHPGHLVEAVRQAFRLAVTGCPGPVLLEFSRELLELDGGEFPELGTPTDSSPVRPAPSESAIADFVELINSARRPVFWLGNGAKIAGAGELLLRLAERTQAPVITTYNGTGVVPTDHPQVFGTLYRHGSAIASDVINEADRVIAIGNSLNAISTKRWELKLPGLVQVDVDTSVIGRYYAVERAIVSDAVEFARSLEGATWSVPSDRTAWLADLQHRRQRWAAGLGRPDTPQGVDPVRVFEVLREHLNEPANLLVDAGNPGIWSLVMPLRGADRYFKPVGFGNMGFALPAAIAASLVDTERMPVAVLGDGSLGMTLGELETAGRERVPMLMVVLDDQGLGNIRQEEQFKYGVGAREAVGVTFSPVDYVSIAESCGWQGWCAASSGELTHALSMAVAAAHSGPAIVQVRIDGDRSVWPTAY